jgi:L-iditol 2-dehydrogenase
MLIGMGNPVYTLPVSAAALREVDILGVFRYANTYAAGIEIVSRKDSIVPDFSKLITHRFRGLEKLDAAFSMAGRTKDDTGRLVLKVVVEMGPDSSHVESQA